MRVFKRDEIVSLIEQSTYSYRRAIAQASKNVRGLRGMVRRNLPPTIATIRSLKFRLHLTGNLTEWIMFMSADVAEPKSMDALLEQVSGRRCFMIDIGANCGSYSIVAGAAMSEGSRITAVEPNPNMANRLKTNLALNGMDDLICIEQVALGDKVGEATLHLDHQNLGQSSLVGSNPRETQGIKVPVKPVTDLLEGMAVEDLFVIKIDVEGFEDRVLLPFFETTPRLPDVLLMETNHSEDWSGDVLGRISELGYQGVFEGEDNTLFKLVPRS